MRIMTGKSTCYNKTNGFTTEGMRLINGGKFLMGTNYEKGFVGDGEGPPREVCVDPFYIDETAVTNLQFSKFVEETKYRTREYKMVCKLKRTFLVIAVALIVRHTYKHIHHICNTRVA